MGVEVRRFYTRYDVGKLQMERRGDADACFNLWIHVIISRVRSVEKEDGGGPVGLNFLKSYEFTAICHMIGLDPTWARNTLQPIAGKPGTRLPKGPKPECSK